MGMTNTKEKINIDIIGTHIYFGSKINLLKYNKEPKSWIDSTPLH
jgi:YHS domain-containing protein